MSKQVTATRLELIILGAIMFVLGAAFQSYIRPAHSSETPGISYSANRIACALEGIQHSLEVEPRK